MYKDKLFRMTRNLLFPFFTGYFTQISTLADVQENVMEYLHVLSRPKVIDQEHDTVWTEAYIDSTVSGSLLYHFHSIYWNGMNENLSLIKHFINAYVQKQL